MKKILLTSILLFSLMLIAIPVVDAANPPPEPPVDMKFVGPAIVGTIQITPALIEGWITATFSGQCRGIQFTMGPFDFGESFEAVKPEYIEGQRLGFVGQGTNPIPLDCAPSKGGYGTEVRIFNVTQFTKIGDVITAHIVAMPIVSK